MYARHVTVHGSPERIDEAVESVRNNVLPVLQACAGRSCLTTDPNFASRSARPSSNRKRRSDARTDSTFSLVSPATISSNISRRRR
jgi:hypothetical protein